MKRSAPRRGQPIHVLGGLLGGWTAMRVLAWTLVAANPHAPEVQLAAAAAEKPASAPAVAPPRAAAPRLAMSRAGETLSAPVLAEPILTPPPSLAAPAPALAPAPPPLTAAPRPDPGLAGGHQLLFLAAFSQLPMPPELAAARARLAAPSPPPSPLASRWSADGWVLLRRQGPGPSSLGALQSSYGASQVGAVLRYRLDRTSANKPSLYLRGYGALNGTREQEVAFGFMARPVAALPVLALAEVRATRNSTGIHPRPAALAVTELPPLKLPFRLQAEAYVQAGYVGGSNASAFVDGQARLDRKLIDIGPADLRAGGGVWGGAQRGAARLDVGPSASLSVRIDGTAAARLSADWRFRLAGRAAPASGPALTLSAGF